MNTDPDLFGNDIARARARRNDPFTSRLAADYVTPSLQQIQRQVLGYAVTKGSRGFVDPELNDHFGSHLSTYRTRRAELVGLGMIEETGEHRSLAPDGKGRKHQVWRITAKGLATLPCDQAA